MTTSRNSRASFSSSSGALLAVPYSLTHGESRNFDLTTTSQDAAAYPVADPPYLSIQVYREKIEDIGKSNENLLFF
jgi:hypothetical protein